MTVFTSDRQCQCPCCGEAFNTDRLFDRHRVGSYARPGQVRGNRRCMTVEEMEAKGWAKNRHGFWKGEAMPAAKLAQMQESRKTKAVAAVAAA